MPPFRYLTATTFSVLLASFFAPAYGQIICPEGSVTDTNFVRQFSSKTGKIVNHTLQSLNEKDFKKTLARLDDALALSNLNPYEKSIIHQMQGQTHYELGDQAKAISAFEAALCSGGLTTEESQAMSLNIGQLYIASGAYDHGADIMEANLDLQSDAEIKPQYVEIITQARVQAEQYDEALPWAERWLAQSNPEANPGANPIANPAARAPYDLLNFLYSETGQKTKRADILKQMIHIWPEDDTLTKALETIEN